MAKPSKSRGRFKIQRALGVEIPGLGRPGSLERRPYPPGQHGQRRRKLSDFSIQLREKQKLRYHYDLREKQLVRAVKLAKKNKGQAWIDSLIVACEQRLVNVVFRLKFAPSMKSAAQLVSHGHIYVNGKRVNVPGQKVKSGDIITISKKGMGSQAYQTAQIRHPLDSVPANYTLSTEGEQAKATVTAVPLATDLPFELNLQLVTDYYSKTK